MRAGKRSWLAIHSYDWQDIHTLLQKVRVHDSVPSCDGCCTCIQLPFNGIKWTSLWYHSSSFQQVCFTNSQKPAQCGSILQRLWVSPKIIIDHISMQFGGYKAAPTRSKALQFPAAACWIVKRNSGDFPWQLFMQATSQFLCGDWFLEHNGTVK